MVALVRSYSTGVACCGTLWSSRCWTEAARVGSLCLPTVRRMKVETGGPIPIKFNSRFGNGIGRDVPGTEALHERLGSCLKSVRGRTSTSPGFRYYDEYLWPAIQV